MNLNFKFNLEIVLPSCTDLFGLYLFVFNKEKLITNNIFGECALALKKVKLADVVQ